MNCGKGAEGSLWVGAAEVGIKFFCMKSRVHEDVTLCCVEDPPRYLGWVL